MKLVKCSIVVFIVTLCVAVTTSSARTVNFSMRIGTSRAGSKVATAEKEYDLDVQTIKKASAEDNVSNDDRDIDAKLIPNSLGLWKKLTTNKYILYPDEATYFSTGNPYSLYIRTSNIWVPTGCYVSGSWNTDAYTAK